MRGEQFVANFGHFLAIAKLGEVVAGHAPPCLERVVVGGDGLLERRIGFQGDLDGGLGVRWPGERRGSRGAQAWNRVLAATPNLAKSLCLACTSASGMPPMRWACTSSGSGSGVLST